MSSFDDAFTALIGNEGGYSDNAADPGGETMWGITARVAHGWGYAGAIKDLPLDTAKAIAKKFYWDPYQCDQFDPRIGLNVFDAAYNGGHPAQWLQAAAGVDQDGVIGAITIAAVRALDPMTVIARFTSSRISYYTSLDAEWPIFGRGWMVRLSRNLSLSAT